MATYFIGLFVGLFLIGTVYSLDPNLTLEAGGLREAEPPRLFGGSVLFSYRFPGPVKERFAPGRTLPSF